MAWIKHTRQEKCDECNQITELYVDEDDYALAERCPRCRWQINFGDEIKRVLYGSEIEYPSDLE